ncbi:Ig-like domain-containing protein, partial [Desulfosarcina sp.]|nr:Ig-like domain-containing protein [Desulfosarcina sp.]
MRLEVTSNAPCASPYDSNYAPIAVISAPINITVNPNSTINDPSNKDQTLCIDTTLASNNNNIVFTIGGGATGASVTGLPPGVSGSYSSNSFTISGTPTASGTFNYTVNTTGGVCTQDSQSGTIIVNPDATISINAADDNTQTICSGQNITQIRYNIGGSATGANATGLPAGINISLSGNVFTLSGSSADTPGIYNYTVVATSGNGCKPASLTGSITINPNLTPTISISATDTDICDGDSVTFNISSQTNEGINPTYQWQINGANVGGATNNFFTTSSLNHNDAVRVIMTSSETCPGSATVTSAAIPITVNDNETPSVSITSNDGDNMICPGDSIEFTAAPIFGGPSPLYQWKINGVNVGGNTTNNTFDTTSLTDGQTVSVVMTSNYECLAVNTATSAGIQITIIPDVTPSVTIVSDDSDNIICSGDSIEFTATPINGGMAPLYQWKINGTDVGGNTTDDTFDTTSLTDGQTVTVVMTSNEPCLAINNVLSNPISIKVQNTVPSPPNNGAIASDPQINGPTTICPVQNGLIFSVDADADPDVTYSWTVPTGFNIISGANTNQITVDATNSAVPGNRDISVQAENACGPSTATSITVVVSNLVEIIAGSDITVCQGTNSINLNGSLSGISPRHKDWDWISSDGGTFGNNGQKLNTTFTLPANIRDNGGSIIITLASTNNIAGCDPASDSFTLTVSKDATISNPSEKTQTVCIDTAITPISFAIAEAGTGGTLTGSLPAGINGVFSDGNFVISGTPTEAGTFNYTVNTTGSCSQQTSNSGTITVNPDHTISDPGNKDQTLCIDTTLASNNGNIVFTLGGGATDASVSGLPTNMTGSLSGSNYTISGTPDQIGTFNYTVTTTGNNCIPAQQTGTIIVNPDDTITNPTNEDQTLCINTTLASNDGNIVFTLGGGATGATVTGLPAGVTSNYNASGKTFTISGTPTELGNFPYTVTTSGDCKPAIHAGTLIVTPNGAITTPTNKDQTLCINTSLADPINAGNIVFTISGGATSATASNLPPGLLLVNTSGNIYTIEGTATVSGTYNYTVTTDGSGCVEDSENGTITVTGDATINPSGNNDQTRCINTSIANIAFVIGGTATGATVANVPNGITGSLSGSAFILSGIPTESGIFNYTVTTTGPCGNVTESGLLTINEDDTITPPTNIDQIVCLGDGIAGITFTIGGDATDATVSGLPAGLSGSLNGNGPNFEISGTPTEFGIFNYTVTTSGICEPATSGGTITVKNAVSIDTQPGNIGVCAGEPASLSVGAMGDDLTYQWYKGSIGDITNPVGSNSNVLNFASTVSGDAGNYYVRVSGNVAANCSYVDSSVGQLNVNQDIIINTLSSDDDICLGDTANNIFTVTASGTISNYEWFKENGATDISIISGQTANSMSITSATLADEGQYYVVLTSPGGACPEIVSTNINLDVVTPANITTFTYPSPVCSDAANALPTLVITGDNGDGGTFVKTSGAGNLEIASNGEIDVVNSDPGSYVVTYTTPNVGPCSTDSETASITINASPTISGEADVCVGSTINLLPSTGGSWSSSNDSFATINNSGLVTGIAAGSVTFTFITNGTSCAAISSSVTVNPLPIISGVEPVCVGNTINLLPSTGGTWTSSNNSFATISDSGLVTGISAGSATFTFTETATGCQATSTSLTVNPLPTISGEAPVCVGSTINLSPSTGGTWSSNNGTIASIDNNGIVTGISAGSARFTFTETTTGCQATSDAVTVNPSPIISGETDVCVNETINLLPSTGGTWVSNNPTIATINNSGLVTAVSDGSATFTFTTTGTSCAASSSTVTVNPLPVIVGNDDVCVGSTINLTSSLGGTWASSDPSIATIDPNTGLVTGVAFGDVTITFMATGTLCSSTKNITASPVPVGGRLTFGDPDPGRVFTICESPGSGYAVDLELEGEVGTVLIWRYRTTNGGWTTIKDNNGIDDYTGDSLSAAQIESLPLTESILIQVVVASGSCSPNAFSTTAIISVIPSDIVPTPVEVSEDVICLGAEVQLSSETGYGNEFGTFEGGAFDYASIDNSGTWRVKDDGVVVNFESSANNIRPNRWERTNPHEFITADINTGVTSLVEWDSYSGNEGNKGFAIVSGDNSSTLETEIFALSSLDEAILTFDQAYNLTAGATISVEISTDGGDTYDTILFQIDGPVSSGNYDQFAEGTPGINQMEFDLGDYLGQTNLRIRFNYEGSQDGDVWAVDNIKVPEGPRNVTLEWWDYTDPDNIVFIGNSNNETWTPKVIGWNVFEVQTLLILDSAGNTCTDISNAQFVEVFAFDEYDVVVNAPTGTCGTMEGPISAVVTGNAQGAITSYPTADGYEGHWEITGPTGPAGYTLTNPDLSTTNPNPINNPNAIFTAIDMGLYTFTWTLESTAVDDLGILVPNTNCPPNTMVVELDTSDCSTLDFDGIDDNVTFRDNYNFNGPFSIELWLKPNAETHDDDGDPVGPNDAIQTILSRRTGTSSTTGYDLRLEGNTVSFNWVDAGGAKTFSSNHPISTTRWYHLALTFDGGNYIMYIDGIQVGTSGGSVPLATPNNVESILGAMDQNVTQPFNPINYFSGWMDELRVWNVTLTKEQIRHMMNQEIIDNVAVRGAIVPIDIPGLTWANLDGYYQMNQPVDIVNGYIIANAGINNDGRMRNIRTWQDETAPIPYTTVRNGDWNNNTAATPWTHGNSVWDYPNAKGIDSTTDIDWNIVVTSHDVTSIRSQHSSSLDQNLTLLGLLVDSGELTITDSGVQNENNNGQGLWVTHYLKLDGQIDLIGESQLVQKRYTPTQINGSKLDVLSSGFLERDQQGTANLFNYNYWSSPVGKINTSANNMALNVGAFLRDGTLSASPKPINWVGGLNATGSSVPEIGLARYWIYYFLNVPRDFPDDYYQWVQVFNSGEIPIGNGYTMKGSGVGDYVNDVQNYVFTGKPNNGTIMNDVGPKSNALVGNPYPSAIDAREFIRDNIPGGDGDPLRSSGSITGTLLFWEHFDTNFTHETRNYQGGYARLNLSGPLEGVIPDIISGDGDFNKIPEYYVPVGQGFIVKGADFWLNAGDTPLQESFDVTFKNSQRIFKREGVVGPGTYEGSVFMRQSNTKGTKSKPPTEEDLIKRVRISYKSPDNLVRPLLLAFIPNDGATDGFDFGYDASNSESLPNDMSWIIEDENFLIQGVGDYIDTKQFKLGVFLSEAGSIEISLDALENMEPNTKVYIYDSLLGTYTKINNENYIFSLDAGDYLDRFYLTFTNKSALSIEDEVLDDNRIFVNYLNDTNEIYIQTPSDIDVKQVYLI